MWGTINIHGFTYVQGLFGLCLLFALSSPAHAGAWPVPVGQGQIITTTVTDSASRGFDDKWALNQDIEFSKFETQFFWEHGLTENITFTGSTTYQDVDFVSRTGNESVQGFGTSGLGGRYSFYKKDGSVAALQFTYVIAGKGENIADADLGRGGNGIDIRLLAGRNFKFLKRDGFIDVQAAHIIRRSNAPSTNKADLTTGLDISNNRQILAQIFYNRTGEKVIGNDRILVNESIKLQGSAVFKRSEKTSLQFGVFQTIAGRNIVQEKGVFAAVWQRY